ncbi:MAG: two-component system, NtrC family, sensor histidine kinase HydH [Acidobacteriota bacterium]|nr:two-component system, NtrC family, sensor histidine kinase HydH [Acidobacteriota bacterium]
MTIGTLHDEQQGLADRVRTLFRERWDARLVKVDRMFSVLMIAQWIFAVLVALFFSPYAWSAKTRVIHTHVYVAVFMGGAIALLPIILAKYRAGSPLTRHVIAISQMLMSALLVHLSGGRIETHFHVFGSLAFLAFYLDWRVLITATVTVASEHFLRGVFWPESVYGITNPEWWRFLEHVFWVAFEDAVLIWGCVIGLRDMQTTAQQQAAVEQLTELEQLKTAALEMALAEFGASA